jgi:hypothetical protein
MSSPDEEHAATYTTDLGTSATTDLGTSEG